MLLLVFAVVLAFVGLTIDIAVGRQLATHLVHVTGGHAGRALWWLGWRVVLTVGGGTAAIALVRELAGSASASGVVALTLAFLLIPFAFFLLPGFTPWAQGVDAVGRDTTPHERGIVSGWWTLVCGLWCFVLWSAVGGFFLGGAAGIGLLG